MQKKKQRQHDEEGRELDDDGIPMPRQFEEAIDTTTITEITGRMRDRNQLGPMFQAMGEAFGTKEKSVDKTVEEWQELQGAINMRMAREMDGLFLRITKLEDIILAINDFLEAKEKEDSA